MTSSPLTVSVSWPTKTMDSSVASSYSLTVRATDKGSPLALSSEATVLITVTPQNTPPKFFSPEANITVQENSLTGTAVYDFQATADGAREGRVRGHRLQHHFRQQRRLVPPWSVHRAAVRRPWLGLRAGPLTRGVGSGRAQPRRCDCRTWWTWLCTWRTWMTTVQCSRAITVGRCRRAVTLAPLWGLSRPATWTKGRLAW